MTDIQTLVIVGGLIINAVAVGWNIIETVRLHKQAKALQESNAKLQSEVNRLSVHLNQEITRLNRINDLTRGLYLSTLRLRYRTRLEFLDKGKDSSEISSSRDYWNEEFTSWVVTFEGSMLEMRAIAKVINDEELLLLIQTLRKSMPSVHPGQTEEVWVETLTVFCNNATAVHERVYRLLEKATDSSQSL